MQIKRYRSYWKWQNRELNKIVKRFTETPEQAIERSKRNENLLPRGLYEWHPSDIEFWMKAPKTK